MKTLITLISFTLLSSHIIAQDNVVNIDFEVDGKQSSYKNATVKFIYDKDTTSAKVEGGKLTIPSSVMKKRSTVIFCIGKYVLQFDSIPVALNNLHPRWTLGVDEKPFDKKKLWMIKSWKNVEIVYYLNPNDGRTFTVDNYKRSKVIRK